MPAMPGREAAAVKHLSRLRQRQLRRTTLAPRSSGCGATIARSSSARVLL
jgi:hypothetical protein